MQKTWVQELLHILTICVPLRKLLYIPLAYYFQIWNENYNPCPDYFIWLLWGSTSTIKIKPAANFYYDWPSIQQEALDLRDPQIMTGNPNHILFSLTLLSLANDLLSSDISNKSIVYASKRSTGYSFPSVFRTKLQCKTLSRGMILNRVKGLHTKPKKRGVWTDTQRNTLESKRTKIIQPKIFFRSSEMEELNVLEL